MANTADITKLLEPSPKRKTMRLFVWTEFCPDYTDGLAFAVAEDIGQAQKKVVESYGCKPYDWGKLKEFPLDELVAFCVSGGG